MYAAEYIRSVFNYDPVSGTLTTKDGSVVTSATIKIFGRYRSTVHCKWLHFYGRWPNNEIDHIDRNHNNDAIFNLREATHAENMHNRVFKNPHGYKGITKRGNKWRVVISTKDGRVSLGSFDTKEAAAEAYADAAYKHHGQFVQLEVK